MSQKLRSENKNRLAQPIEGTQVQVPRVPKNSSNNLATGLDFLSEGQHSVSSNHSSNCSEKPMIVVNLDVGHQADTINVFEGDDVKELAEKFCERHSLNEECIDYLVYNIRAQLDQHKRKMMSKKERANNNNQAQGLNIIGGDISSGKGSLISGRMQPPENFDIQERNEEEEDKDTTESQESIKTSCSDSEHQARQRSVKSSINAESIMQENKNLERESLEDVKHHFNNEGSCSDLNKSAAENQYENWSKLIKDKSTTNKQMLSNINSIASSNMNNILKAAGSTNALSGKSSLEAFQKQPNLNLNTSSSNSNTSRDAFDRLYKKGLESKKKKEEFGKKIQEERESRNLKEATFRPSISPRRDSVQTNSPNTSCLSSQRGRDTLKQEKSLERDSSLNTSTLTNRRHQGENIYEYLVRDGKEHSMRREKSQLMKEEMLKEIYKFRPSISPESHKILENIRYSEKFESIHDKLFKKGQKDQQKKKEMLDKEFDKYYPFQPQIAPKISPNRNESQTQLIDRLLNSKQKNEQKLIEVRKMENRPIDKETGQPLYCPKITKNEIYQKVKARDLEEEYTYIHESATSNRRDRSISNSDGRDNRSRKSKSPASKKDFLKLNKMVKGELSGGVQSKPLQRSGSIRDLTPKKQEQKSPLNPKENKKRESNTFNNNNSFIAENRAVVCTSGVTINPSSVNINNNKQTNKPSTGLKNTTATSNIISEDEKTVKLEKKTAADMGERRTVVDFGDVIKTIFNQLDNDGDGEISSENIDLSSIDAKVLDIIQDILFDMDDNNLVMKEQNFANEIVRRGLLEETVKVSLGLVENISLKNKPNDSKDNLNDFQGYQDNSGYTNQKPKRPGHQQQFSFGGGDFDPYKNILIEREKVPIPDLFDVNPPLNNNNSISKHEASSIELTVRYKKMMEKGQKH